MRWRIAESYWARSFGAPRFWEVATWAFAVAPVVVMTHFASNLTRAWSAVAAPSTQGPASLIRLGATLARFLAATAVAPFAGAALLLTLLLSAVPIAVVRSLAASIQRVIASTLGDSYIFTGSVTRSAAVTNPGYNAISSGWRLLVRTS